MILTKKTLYTFAIMIGIAFSIGFSDLTSNYFAFSETNTSDKTTTITPKLNADLNNSKIQDSKVVFLTDGLFSDAGWGAFGYNAAQSLQANYGYNVDFKENVAIPDISSTLTEYANDGYGLIISSWI